MSLTLRLRSCRIDADEALRLGLVSTVVEPDHLLNHAVALAQKIAHYSHPVVAKAKECVNMAEQSGLSAGLSYERWGLSASKYIMTIGLRFCMIFTAEESFRV